MLGIVWVGGPLSEDTVAADFFLCSNTCFNVSFPVSWIKPLLVLGNICGCKSGADGIGSTGGTVEIQGHDLSKCMCAYFL